MNTQTSPIVVDSIKPTIQFEPLMKNGYTFNFKANALKVIALWKQDLYQQMGFIGATTFLALIVEDSSFGDLVLISILTIIFWASAFMNADKLVKGQSIEKEDWFSGRNHFWNLVVLSLKMSLFILLPMVLLALINFVATDAGIVNPIIENSLICIGSIWGVYFVTSCSLSVLLMVVFKVEDWDAIHTSRKLVRHHIGWFLFFNILIILTSFLGPIGILLQFSLINATALLFCLVLTEAMNGQDMEDAALRT